MGFELTRADYTAINNGDASYLNAKGIERYTRGAYEEAIEYYRLAAVMGDDCAISNLGYCYMYARSVPRNMDLAVAYFKMAAERDNIDALYKLGDIYRHGADQIPADAELGLYYFDKAMALVDECQENYLDYPSLFFAMAKEFMEDGLRETDLELAYFYLKIAQDGYKLMLNEGAEFYREVLKRVEATMDAPCFEGIEIEDPLGEEE